MFEEKKKTVLQEHTVQKGYAANNIQSLQRREAVFKDLRIEYDKKKQYNKSSTVQLCPDKDIDTIFKLCHNNYSEISIEDAVSYYNSIRDGYYPRIGNHNAIIRPWGDNYRIEKKTFSGGGPMGRTAEDGGEEAVFSESSFGGNVLDRFKMEMTINSQSIAGVRKRQPLNQVMGGSAYDQTGIQNSEFLHMVGHQLGGQDAEENLMPGYHALNTAMIPIENFVRNLAIMGINATYEVIFYPRVGNAIWVSQATITIGFRYEEEDKKYSWNIEILGPDRLSEESYQEILKQIEEIKGELFGT